MARLNRRRIRSGKADLISIDPVGKLKAKDVAKLKPKSKCCKDSPRCTRCPVVLKRLCEQDCASMCGKDFTKALAKARRR